MRDEEVLVYGSGIPMVIEKSGDREKAYDVFSRLMKDRILFIGRPIDDFLANCVVACLLHLEINDKGKPIKMYINSPGGVITAGLAILDTMNLVSSPVHTYCIGSCASMAAVLLAAGDKGHRYILPNAEVMIHQPWGGAKGQCSDVQIQARHIESMKQSINAKLAAFTGKTIEQIEKDTDRDNFFKAEEAVAYGLVDEIIAKRV